VIIVTPSGFRIVSFAAVIRVVTQRSSPLSGEERCVTTLITAAKETSFRKASFSRCFPSTRFQTFSNSSGLKSVFEKLCCGDGLVWKVGLEIKLRFQISAAYCGRCLRRERTVAKSQGQKSQNLVDGNSKESLVKISEFC